MTIINSAYLIPLLLIYILIATYFIKRSISFKNWIADYWSLKQTKRKIFSRWLYLLSIFLFMISLLDFRGKEQVVKGNIPDQRTIIAIDSSLSMLAEDVRPNRFLKSIQIARHFVKNSPGHQFSIVVFSDIQKRILPFTDDIDLIDSRLAALEKVSSVGGGSNITQAIQEIINYFDVGSDDPEGNILLFTDGEESEDKFDLKIPKKINIALVGVGTAKGSNIPLRYEDGGFKGYKESKGQQIISKLEEGLLKEISSKISNSKLIIANSYTLPTDELKSFFRNQFKKRHGNSDMRIRPVKSHYILIPAIIVYVLSVIFQFGRTNVGVSIIVLMFFVINTKAVENETKMDPKLVQSLNKIKSGKAEKNEILKTAEILLKNNKDKESLELYEEYSKNNKEYEVEFNKITAKLKNKKIDSAIEEYQNFLNSNAPVDLKDKLRSNMILALKGDDKNKKDDQKENKENKNQSENKENKENNGEKEKKDQKENEGKQKDNQSENQSKENQKNKNGEGKNSGDKKDQKKDQQDKEKNKDNDDQKKDGENEDQKQNGNKENKPKSLEEKEKQEELRRKMLKIPGMVKQIMNDDRELQKRMMDTSTKEKGENKPKRDW